MISLFAKIASCPPFGCLGASHEADYASGVRFSVEVSYFSGLSLAASTRNNDERGRSQDAKVLAACRPSPTVSSPLRLPGATSTSYDIHGHRHARRRQHGLAALGDHAGRSRPEGFRHASRRHRFQDQRSGLQTITLTSALPQLPDPVNINGFSQSGETGYTGPPLIAIDGSGISSSAILSATASSTTIEGLAVVGGSGICIQLSGGIHNLIEGCYIGTPDGSTAQGNDVGIQVSNSANDTISGNVIPGNIQDGIDLVNNSSAALIQGNTLGLNATGTELLSNGGNGIYDSLFHNADSYVERG